MTDKILSEDDTDELIPVETPPEQAADVADDAADDEDDDHEDERLAESEDDSEDDITKQNNHDRRLKRRERQKRARENAQRELMELRQTVAILSQRVANTETQTVTAQANVATQSVEQQLAKAIAEVEQAERIIAAATEAGNGKDVVAAMRIRDAAIAQAQQMQYAKQQLEQTKQQAATPRPDPNVVNYAREWMEANPWYDPQGRDRDSALTKAIDNELAREGYDPTSRRYWEELTSRVADAVGDGNTAATPAQASSPRRKAPPTGNTREHAPATTKNEIYVTPERKAAMIEAGVWDDPVRRQAMLKAYKAYDNGSAR